MVQKLFSTIDRSKTVVFGAPDLPKTIIKSKTYAPAAILGQSKITTTHEYLIIGHAETVEFSRQ
jgi:hypothetical protein